MLFSKKVPLAEQIGYIRTPERAGCGGGSCEVLRVPVRSRLAVRSDLFATGLVLLLLAFFLGSAALTLWNSYNNTVDSARRRASSASEVVAANVSWLLEASRQILERVDDNADSYKSGVPHDGGVYLKRAIQNLPGDPRIYLVDANGVARITTDEQFKSIDIRDRDYFRAVEQGAQFYVSALMVSRQNNEPIFAISKRIERNGAFAGAAILSFNANLMFKVWQSLGLDRNSTVSVLRDDGKLVLRYPAPPAPLDLRSYVLFTDYLKRAPSGVYDAVSPADGVNRLVAYRRVDGTGLVALASLGREAVISSWWDTFYASLAIVGPMAILLCVLAWLAAQWLKRDMDQRDRIAVALEQNQTLFREIHHRVKNNLQAVSALVSLQKLEPSAKREMMQRIQAMVAVHEHIYRSDEFGAVHASSYLPAIIDKLLEAYAISAPVEYDVEPLEVDRDAALPLGLIANEVVSNAIKYGLREGSGRLRISLARSLDGLKGVLEIADDGPGFDPERQASGMGSRLIRGLASQLGGEVTYSFNGGTIVTLVFPLAPRMPAPQVKSAASARLH